VGRSLISFDVKFSDRFAIDLWFYPFTLCSPMETDSLFYRLFKEKPKLLFELLGEKVPRIAYTFGSYEVKQTSLRGDGILEPVRSPKSPKIISDIF
jgi:Protein of unknown function (DUF2887)